MNEGAQDEPQVDDLIGKVFDARYRIEERLGEGGIGRVYKARHLTLGKFVALKVLLTKYENVLVLQKRFQREAEALAALSHPNIVTVTDFGVADGTPYLVMELLEGTDLAHVIHAHPTGLDPKRVVEIMRQVLRALSYAHAQGLVHRDLKPHNIFVRTMGDGSDHVEVLDFGLARFMGDAQRGAMKLTHAGALIGTPTYMAPEQASGEDVDARADIYAVGCVMFEAFTGRRVFERPNQGEVLRAHLMHIPPTISQADPGLQTQPELDALIAMSLAKTPAARYQTANDMITALEALGPNPVQRVSTRPPLNQPISMVLPTKDIDPKKGPATREAPTPRNEDSDIQLTRNRLPMMVGVGCFLLVLCSAVAVSMWFVDFGALVDAVGTEESEPTPTVAPEVPASDLLSAGLDPELAALHEETQTPPRAGSGLDVGLIARIQAWGQAVPSRRQDPRYHLVLAHAYARHSTDENPVYGGIAVMEYSNANSADRGARGDPRMLSDLVRFYLADQPELSEQASSLIELAYGEEALATVTEASVDAIPAHRTKLDALAERLRRQAAAAPP